MQAFSTRLLGLLLCNAILLLPGCNSIGKTSLANRWDSEANATIVGAKEHPIPQPEVIGSVNGLLDVALEAAPAKVTVAGRTFLSNVYNSSYIPPVLKAKRGDKVRIKLVNNIGTADIMIDKPQFTNLHYHGMNITPQEPGDNVFVLVPPALSGSDPMHGITQSPYLKDNTYTYEYAVPKDHPQGLHWYHSHTHGYGEDQVLSGMSGLLVIDGYIEQHYPELNTLQRKTFLLKDIALPDTKDGDPKTKTINGTIGATETIRPGEWQVWNLANIGADSFFEFVVDGHKFWMLARDGNVIENPEEETSVLLPPAARAVIAIQGNKPGLYGIRSLDVDTGPAGDDNSQVVLASLKIEGQPVTEDATLAPRLLRPAAKIASIHPRAEDLKKMPITRQRVIEFSETSDGKTFFINRKQYQHDRIDTEVKLGDVEEWTVRNVTGERHVFHIHQLDFLVKEINHDDQDSTGLRDTIDVPYQFDGAPGEVKLIVPFTNPNIVGKFVYHCHILEHADNGMMANIVVKKSTK
ncbi:multicopper oxidase family protein [Methyloglobulus sp.]|uniref:multicopper oxidase family protein n=1 Tax=Methyloglobulus sp. TaxID=2518622 RepID=UPI003989F6A1